MGSGLTSTLSEFTKKSELAKNSLVGESSDDLPPPTGRNPGTRAHARLGRVFSSTFARYLLGFFVGVAATLAWQSYGGPARKTIASWSPHLAWLATTAAPHGIPSDRIKATSLALAAVHQSVDKLETEISKLETQGGPDRTAASQPSRRASRRP